MCYANFICIIKSIFAIAIQHNKEISSFPSFIIQNMGYNSKDSSTRNVPSLKASASDVLIASYGFYWNLIEKQLPQTLLSYLNERKNLSLICYEIIDWSELQSDLREKAKSRIIYIRIDTCCLYLKWLLLLLLFAFSSNQAVILTVCKGKG